MIIDTHVHIWEVPPVAPVVPTAKPTATPDEPATPLRNMLERRETGVNVLRRLFRRPDQSVLNLLKAQR